MTESRKQWLTWGEDSQAELLRAGLRRQYVVGSKFNQEDLQGQSINFTNRTVAAYILSEKFWGEIDLKLWLP